MKKAPLTTRFSPELNAILLTQIKSDEPANPNIVAELVENNMGLVVQIIQSIIRRYQLKVPPEVMEDLKQTGRLGLLRAIRSYDPAKSSFSTYASTAIRNELLNNLNLMLLEQDGRISNCTDGIRRKRSGPISLETPLDTRSTSQPKRLGDTLEDPCGLDVLTRLIHRDLYNALNRIKPRAAQCIALNRGLGPAYEEMSTKEIGGILGVSPTTVQNNIISGIQQLRGLLLEAA